MAKEKRYSDLDLDFITHPVSGDISLKYDDEAVKRSIRNLVFMGIFEKPFHPEIRSEIRKLLFENLNPITTFELKKEIEDIISEHEPRARVMEVNVSTRDSYGGASYINVTINFKIIGIPNEVFDMSMALTRAR